MKIVNNILGSKMGAVYLSALELGLAPVADIAKKAGIPRSTCYLIIDELKEKGLVSEVVENNRTRIIAESPKKIVSLLQQQIEKFSDRQKNLQNILPELEALHNAYSYKPTVRFYKGIEGVKTVLEETLEVKEILVLCSGYDKPIEKKLSAYLDKYFEEVDKRKIKTYELLGPAPDLEPYIKKYKSPLHQLKKLPDLPDSLNLPKHHIDKLIFGSKLAIISFEFLNATVLKHAPIADFEKNLFLQLWHST